MHARVLIAASLSVALIGGSLASAQELPPLAPPVEPPLGLESVPVPPDIAPPPGTEAARAAHLDQLFDELADPGNRRWQLTQAQIQAVWNQSGSPSMDLLAQRADEAVAEQDLDTALRFLDDLVRLAPDFAEGWNKRATVHFMRDDYGRSLRDIARTLELEPRHFGAYAGLGIILDRLGDEKGALEAYRRAVSIHPHLPGAAEGIRKLRRTVEGEPT